MTDEETVLIDAEFNDAVTTYWLLSGIIICVVTLVGIPLLPFWLIGGKFVTRKYLASHQCTLTDRSLKFKKGILTKIEKTIPLDRITDVGTIQGPIMRAFGLESLSVETAGQSSVGALLRITGIADGQAFRDAVLKQRDRVVGTADQVGPSRPTADLTAGGEPIGLLIEIRDILVRIENQSK